MKWPKDLLKELRRQGFKRSWLSMGGGNPCVVYTKAVGVRKLELQLWSDGRHRVSHFHSTRYSQHGCMCTHPSDFKTVAEMRTAITRELTRKDHKNMVEVPQ